MQFSIHEAVVTDNRDPDKLGRAKVCFELLEGRPESHWFRVLQVSAGAAGNLSAPPEPGDHVLVLLADRWGSHGYILGSLSHGQAPVSAPPADPSALAAGGQVSTWLPKIGDSAPTERRVWQSRSGHRVVFEDSADAEQLQFWSADSGCALVLDATRGHILLASPKGDLHLRAGGDLFLEAGGTLHAHSRDQMTLSAARALSIESRAELSLSAGSSLSASAKAEATLSGAKLSLDAQGPASLSGATLNLRASANGQLQSQGPLIIRGALVAIN